MAGSAPAGRTRWPSASAPARRPALPLGWAGVGCPGAAGPGGGRRVQLDGSEQAVRRPKLVPKPPSFPRPAAPPPATLRLRATVTGFTDRGAAKLLAVVPAVSFSVPGLPERRPGPVQPT
ncbi:unnamed protein product [Coccothraustes coccothraustes]